MNELKFLQQKVNALRSYTFSWLTYLSLLLLLENGNNWYSVLFCSVYITSWGYQVHQLFYIEEQLASQVKECNKNENISLLQISCHECKLLFGIYLILMVLFLSFVFISSNLAQKESFGLLLLGFFLPLINTCMQIGIVRNKWTKISVHIGLFLLPRPLTSPYSLANNKEHLAKEAKHMLMLLDQYNLEKKQNTTTKNCDHK